MRLLPLLLTLIVISYPAFAKLECDPTSNTKKPDPANPESYLYCNLEGHFTKRKCVSGKVFDAESGQCIALHQSDSPNNDEEDPLSKPFYQAPDDLCGSGIPLTILSAPVACNPSISSCPDGYVCRMYERTGTSYCCQGSPILPTGSSSQIMCSKEQVTYIEPETGKPKACVLSDESSCPLGFMCNLVRGTTTRCCGKDLGCPFNSAALLNSKSTSHVECSPNQKSSCQKGFSCVRSSTLNKNICCSNPEDVDDYECPNGESPLSGSCSSSKPCPSGYACREGKCCPAAAVCPAGTPLGGGPTACNEVNICNGGFDCVTNAGKQYCCPSREKVCSLPRHNGVTCASSRSSVTKYFFDVSTGACRAFKFSQCGGNSNNFNSLEECEGFCVDTQCKNGQAYRIGAVNAACDVLSPSTCPRHHLCETPLFGSNPICCPNAEMTCNEMVSAGTPCYGRSITLQRFYFNPLTRKCQPFQYYGCNGNGNNFGSMTECQNLCLNAVDNVCGGVAPLFDPNQQPQRCSEAVPCPSGYDCNSEDYCCPTPKTACNAALSRGNVCSGTSSKSVWYYDSSSRKCQMFSYNGCGGTANRFSSQKACNEFCVETSNVLGTCPRGMNVYFEKGAAVPKSCTLNVMGTCPSSSSCVRSTTNQPICCQTVTSCPENRTPYVIPGSKSVVACNPDGNDCPEDNICVESSTVNGFHMCCSSSLSANQRPPSPIRGGKTRKEPETLAALIRSISPCPPTLQSNGHTCTVNGIGECPNNHICFRDVGFEEGTCCRTPPPKCAQKSFIPVFLEGTQVQVCQVDLGGCSRDSRCMTSTVPKLAICCKKYEPPARPGQEGNHAKQVCKNGSPPFMNAGIAQECNFVHNTCPSGFKCEFSSTGRAVCCSDMEAAIRCPAGSSVFEYGGRPLACPPGSTKCPMGYNCVPSMNPQHHLCCSASGSNIKAVPQCTRGVAYVNPGNNERQYCSPILNNCPSGYHCLDSDQPGQYICCTQGDLNDRFKGFCPPRQIPHVSRDGYPPTCHMQLNPCPTTAPYVCIYSAEKQDSFCCAPIDTAVRTFIPDNVAARPMKKMGSEVPDFGSELSSQTFPGPNGMTQTFPGGPAVLGVGHVAVPDPIPGVSSDRILPPGMNVNSNIGNNNSPLGNINSPLGNNNPSLGNSNSPFGNNNPSLGNNNSPYGNHGGQSVNLLNSGNSQQPIIISVQGGGDALTAADFNRASTLNIGDNTGVNNGNGQSSGVITQFNGMGVSTPDFSFASGCPLGSRPLVRTDRSVAECAEQPCPEGFACVFAEAENRFQCCSSTSIMLASSNSISKPDVSDTVQQVGSSQLECPPGFYMIDGKCLKVLFAGQKGCLDDAQCSAKEANSTCDSGYCVCPIDKPLVHGGRCISTCPEGFANIAGRCYDPTTVIFMDSVDERANGTIGGYCLETLVEEKRCDVLDAYCSEKTITCQCKPGFDLKMDFGNIEDKGVCERIKSSKFQENQPLPASQQIDEELYFIDIGSASAVEVGNSTANDDTEDLNKYLIQTDDLIPVFA